MSGIISTWILGICAVCLFSAAAGTAVGEGRQRDILRLVGTAAIVWVLFSPFTSGKVNPGREFETFQTNLTESDALEEMTAQAEHMTAQRIEEYILTQAEMQEIICSAYVKCHYTDGAFYLDSCRIAYDPQPPAQERAAFEEQIALALGVDQKYILGW